MCRWPDGRFIFFIFVCVTKVARQATMTRLLSLVGDGEESNLVNSNPSTIRSLCTTWGSRALQSLVRGGDLGLVIAGSRQRTKGVNDLIVSTTTARLSCSVRNRKGTTVTAGRRPNGRWAVPRVPRSSYSTHFAASGSLGLAGGEHRMIRV